MRNKLEGHFLGQRRATGGVGNSSRIFIDADQESIYSRRTSQEH